MSFDKIAARLDLFRDEMIDLQIKLASIPAISPASGGEGEARKADFLIAYLRSRESRISKSSGRLISTRRPATGPTSSPATPAETPPGRFGS